MTILNGSTLTPSLVAPPVTVFEADVTLHLTVDDGYGGTASSDVTVHIANINHPPTASAPANISVTDLNSFNRQIGRYDLRKNSKKAGLRLRDREAHRLWRPKTLQPTER